MKKILGITSALLLSGALTACNADDQEALDTRYQNDTRPIGYYSNDNMDRGDGPLTQVADPKRERNNNNLGTTGVNYTEDYKGGDLAQKIAKKVNKMSNVDDARVVVNEDTVLIGVDTSDKNDEDVKKSVKEEVQKTTKKNIRVTTDEEMFTRIENVDNDLRKGEGYKEVESDVTGIMNDVGDAVQRPLENNR